MKKWLIVLGLILIILVSCLQKQGYCGDYFTYSEIRVNGASINDGSAGGWLFGEEASAFLNYLKLYSKVYTVHYKDYQVKSSFYINNNAIINTGHIAFQSGHAGYYGPMVTSGQQYMKPAYYRWGENAGYGSRLRWVIMTGCSTLYDGVDLFTTKTVHWNDGPYPLLRWQTAFHGLHGILGYRSLGASWCSSTASSADVMRNLAGYLRWGYTFYDSWYWSNYYYNYLRGMSIEPAVLCAIDPATGKPYSISEKLLTMKKVPAPVHPTKLSYSYWKFGNPKYR